jgi:uncharacterized protein YndB with AHSA1/START domain
LTSEPELDPASVEIDRFYPHSPAAVWQALTDPIALSRWLTPVTGFAVEVGNHFILNVPSQPPGEIACEVLAVRSGAGLTLGWVDLRAPRPARWVVDWRLRPEGRGTRMFLDHKGFDTDDRRQKMARNAMERMWRGRMAELGRLLDGAD